MQCFGGAMPASGFDGAFDAVAFAKTWVCISVLRGGNKMRIRNCGTCVRLENKRQIMQVCHATV